jgi:hypothetical protein
MMHLLRNLRDICNVVKDLVHNQLMGDGNADSIGSYVERLVVGDCMSVSPFGLPVVQTQ